jgi:hypothetical protein
VQHDAPTTRAKEGHGHDKIIHSVFLLGPHIWVTPTDPIYFDRKVCEADRIKLLEKLTKEDAIIPGYRPPACIEFTSKVKLCNGSTSAENMGPPHCH